MRALLPVLPWLLVLLAIPAGVTLADDPVGTDAVAPLLARLAEDPADAEALLGLADLHEKAGRREAARRHLVAFLRLVHGHARRVEAARRAVALLPAFPFEHLEDDERGNGARVFHNVIDGALAVEVPGGPYRRHVEHDGPDGKGPDGMLTFEVDVPTYLIDLHEATNAAHDAFLWEGGFEVPDLFGADGAVWRDDEDEGPHWRMLAYGSADASLPRWGPSFFEARARARWAGKRVPTQVEWEKAARGGIHLDMEARVRNPFPDRPFPWGDAPVIAPDGTYRANVDDTIPRDDSAREDRSLPVDSLLAGASPYGCLHMAGNVSEWNDEPWPHPKARAVRGGYFNDHTSSARIHHREPRTAAAWGMSTLFKTGLRCAANAPPTGELDAEELEGPDPLDSERLVRVAIEAEQAGDRGRAFRFARAAARLTRHGPGRVHLVRWVAALRPEDPWVREGDRWRNLIDGKQAVRSAGLLVDVFEATDADLMRFAAEGGYEESSYWSEAGWRLRSSGAYVNVARIGAGDLPATFITHHEAVAYCTWARKRLPTAQEWDAIAGVGVRKHPWGDADPLDPTPRCACREAIDARHVSTSEDVRVPVGSFPTGTSPDGVADLYGSVFEWLEGVADTDSPTLRALAGGCFWTDAEDLAGPDRPHHDPGDEGLAGVGSRDVAFGFRCVATR